MDASAAMTRARFVRLEEVFSAALEVPAERRPVRVAELCGSDLKLAAQVLRLLYTREQVDGGAFLRPVARVEPDQIEPPGESDRSGRDIDGFRLIRRIAVGGMGTVYEAAQDSPRRSVAVKLMRGALLDPEARRRFTREGQILAELRHPNIAQIYVSGAYRDAGVDMPYLAMEFVDGGQDLLAYAEQRSLTTRARLGLFLTVCEAVHHGHQRGVIHRDLKPANILVDTAGRPKVIDFGVARLLEAELGSATQLTDARQLIGTLHYMSPEQIRGRSVDTRGDVYALGIILYQLLTGRMPYEMKGADLAEAVQAIDKAAPTPPGTLNRSLRGDIETIVLRALEKPVERRYPSVEALSEDIRCYLDGRTIRARTPTLGYQLARLMSRHKTAAGLLGLLMACLIGFSVMVSSLYLRSEAQRMRAEQAEASARSEAKAAREVSDYLVNLFQSLDPWTAAGADKASGGVFSVLEVLDREARSIPEKLKNQPLTQAEVLTALGGVYGRMELYGRAAAALRSALELRRGVWGPDHPSVAKAARSLGSVLRLKGESRAAESLLREALSLHRQFDAADSELRFIAPSWLEELGVLVSSQGRHDEAETLVREALEAHDKLRAADDPNVLAARLTLARVLRLRGECAAAEALCREVLALCRRTLPENAELTLTAIRGLSGALRDQGNFVAAEESLRETRHQLLQWEGAESGSTSETRSWEVFGMITELAALMKARGDLEAAESLHRQALDLLRKRYGPDHPLTGTLLNELMHVLAAKGDVAGLQTIHAELLEHRQRAGVLPEDHPARSGAALHLGVAALAQGDAAGAEPLLRECVALRSAALSPEHWLTAYAESALGECLAAQGRYGEAEPLLLRGYQGVRAPLGRRERRTLRALRRLVELYEAWQAAEPNRQGADQAAEWRMELDAHLGSGSPVMAGEAGEP